MTQYTVKKRLVSVGRDYDVLDESGKVVFRIDGKVRFARTFDVTDPEGNVLFAVKEKLLTLDRTHVVSAPGGAETVVRMTSTANAQPMRFEIETPGQAPMTAQGSFQGDGLTILRGGSTLGSVSRQQETAIHEIFRVYAASPEEAALVLALAMSLVESDSGRGAAP